MPVEMSIPFALAPDGRIATESDPYRRALQRVMALVGTAPGERLMDADFGVRVDRLVLSEDDGVADSELHNMIMTAMQDYEPGVKVTSANPIFDLHGDGITSIDVEIELTEDPTGPGASRWVNTATIRPGGSVSEVIRG